MPRATRRTTSRFLLTSLLGVSWFKY
jgi:hypothetical protein